MNPESPASGRPDEDLSKRSPQETRRLISAVIHSALPALLPLKERRQIDIVLFHLLTN